MNNTLEITHAGRSYIVAADGTIQTAFRLGSCIEADEVRLVAAPEFLLDRSLSAQLHNYWANVARKTQVKQ